MDQNVRYFVPAPQDEYGNTVIRRVIFSAYVEKHANPDYQHEAFDTLRVIEPLEIKEKWPTLNRTGFMEVQDDTIGELTFDRWSELTGFKPTNEYRR